MIDLPLPDPDARVASESLSQLIADDIAVSGGWIPFSRYMQLALYVPQLGYYSGGSQKFGMAGDFVTAPEISPVFARVLARQLAQLLPDCGNTVYEFGAGSGALAADLLLALDQLGSLPDQYCIVELSADLVDRQRSCLKDYCPQWIERVNWLTSLPDCIDGVVIGNEVLDAMPCELIYWQSTRPQQRGVIVKDHQFTWQDRPIQNPNLLSLAQSVVPDGDYLSEINLVQPAFIATLGQKLHKGALLFIDYGFPRHEYYHPQRHMGTLIGHYRQHTIQDPFFMPGLTDLTSHVDFTAIAEAGLNAALDLIGYTSQAQFLINCGITDVLADIAPVGHPDYLRAAAAVQQLISSAEMGELFKVIGFGRGVTLNWLGLMDGDRCHTL